MAQSVKNLPAAKETWFDPWVGKIPWRRAWQLTSAFLLGESPVDRGAWQESQRVGHDWGDCARMHSMYKSEVLLVSQDIKLHHFLRKISHTPFFLVLYSFLPRDKRFFFPLQINLACYRTSYKWNHTICILLYKASFSQHNDLDIHLYGYVFK